MKIDAWTQWAKSIQILKIRLFEVDLLKYLYFKKPVSFPQSNPHFFNVYS